MSVTTCGNCEYYHETWGGAYCTNPNSLEYHEPISELEDKHWSECRQIAHYDDELKDAKRLLRLAVEDIVWLNEHTVDGEGRCLIETATDMETCLACPLNVNNPHICGWKHQAEALALIGEDGDAP